MGSIKTPDQCNTRLKTVQKRKRQAVCHNDRSGAGPVDVPYEDELDQIRMMDDSIEPEVIRDISGASYKTLSGSQTAAAVTSGATPVAEATATPTTSSSEESAETEAGTNTPHRTVRVNNTRLQHMKEFFAELTNLEEAREQRRAQREVIKEERRQAKMQLKEEMRKERKKMHEEKMRLLTMVLAQPKP